MVSFHALEPLNSSRERITTYYIIIISIPIAIVIRIVIVIHIIISCRVQKKMLPLRPLALACLVADRSTQRILVPAARSVL